MRLDVPIARGRTADVFAWDDSHILKLYHDWFPASDIEYEAQVTRTVQTVEIPMAAVKAIVEVQGRLGLLFERVRGVTMLEQISRRPWQVISLARQFADLHAGVHTQTIPDLPSQRRRLRANITSASELTETVQDAIVNALSLLPDGDYLCHGDFHPGNILMTPNGAIIIDWIDATRGHPLADVARTVLLLDGGTPPSAAIARQVFIIVRHLFIRGYLSRYFQLRPANRDQLAAWQPVVAAARLNEHIPDEMERLLGLVHAGIDSRTPV